MIRKLLTMNGRYKRCDDMPTGRGVLFAIIGTLAFIALASAMAIWVQP